MVNLNIFRKDDIEMECKFTDIRAGKGVCSAKQYLPDGTAIPIADFLTVRDRANNTVWVTEVRGRGADPQRAVKVLQNFAKDVWNIPNVRFTPNVPEEIGPAPGQPIR